MRRCLRLCEQLSFEFVLVAPCSELNRKLLDSVDRLQLSGLFVEVVSTRGRRAAQWGEDWWDEEETDTTAVSTGGGSGHDNRQQYSSLYTVNPTRDTLRLITAYANMLCPILDAYNATYESLKRLVGTTLNEKEFITVVQEEVRTRHESGKCKYGEYRSQYGRCLAADINTELTLSYCSQS